MAHMRAADEMWQRMAGLPNYKNPLFFSTGLGFALSYTPAIAMVGKYFNERKALAYGIALSGSDIFTCLHFSFFSLILYFSHLTCSIFLSLFPPVCIYCVPLCFFQSAFQFLIPCSPSLFSCFISFHQIRCYLIFRQWHWDLPPGSCSSAPYRVLFLERSAAHSWSIRFQLVCLWCSDEATGTKRKSKVSSLVFWCILLGYGRNMLQK